MLLSLRIFDGSLFCQTRLFRVARRQIRYRHSSSVRQFDFVGQNRTFIYAFRCVLLLSIGVIFLRAFTQMLFYKPVRRAGDLAALLTNLEPRDVLFVDEIHRLSPQVEEILYPAMEDYQIDIMIGEGPAARSIKLDLPPFTLVGATTRAGLLTSPLRDRFGIVQRLEFYSTVELTAIVKRSAHILNVTADDEGANEIARRSRGTPPQNSRRFPRA